MSTSNICGDRIKALHNQGQFEAAAHVAAAALQNRPDNGPLWELLGIACHAMKDFESATRALETATLLTPLSLSAQVALAGCYLVTGHGEVARSMYQHLVEFRGRLSVQLLRMVVAGLSRLHEPHLALEVAREWARREPDDEAAVYAVARYMRLVEYPPELILPIAHHAFQLAPHRIRNRVALALLHHQCGDLLEAYRLVTAIGTEPLIAACCPARLLGLISLFSAMGDTGRRDACRSRRVSLLAQAG
jgi:tetratricopeptide (TPR) repeat protein